MALPALLLLTARQLLGERVTANLERLREWLTKHSASALSILLLIIGINLTLNGFATVASAS